MDNYFLDLEYISQTKINDYIIMSRLIELEVGKQQSFWATNLLQQDGLYIYIFRFWFLPDSDDEGCTVFDFGYFDLIIMICYFFQVTTSKSSFNTAEGNRNFFIDIKSF